MADLVGDSSVTYTALTVAGTGYARLFGSSNVGYTFTSAAATGTGISECGESSFETTYYLLEAFGEGISPYAYSGVRLAVNDIYPLQVGPPILTVDAIAAVGVMGASDEGIPLLEAINTVHENVPILAFVATQSTGICGDVADSDNRLLSIQASSAGASARQGESKQRLDWLVVQSSGLCQSLAISSEALWLMQAESWGGPQRPCLSSLELFTLDSVSSGVSSQYGTGSMQPLPLVEFESGGFTSRVASVTLTLPAFTGTGAGSTQGMAASELELPMWGAAGQGASLAGVSILELPTWIVFGAGTNSVTVPAGTAAARGAAYAMQTQTRALVQDANSRFNSYAAHGTVMLAANEDGLFVLGGATDVGVKINSSMVLPVSDLDDAQLKRIAQLTVGYRADGRMLLNLHTDDGQTLSYTMEPVTGTKCQPNRVKVGRGSKSRYWEFGINNINGCDHAIDKLDVDWQILSRRVP